MPDIILKRRIPETCTDFVNESFLKGFNIGKAEGRKETAKAIFEELEKKKANTNQGSLVVFWTSIEDLKAKFLKDEKAEEVKDDDNN